MPVSLHSKGSEWKKWDLHIHSKYSYESGAKLEVIDIFKSAIEKGISVISITDHSNVDSLDEIWDVWENKSVNIDGKDIKISDCIEFLPGCELKTDKGKKGVHIVVVFPKYFEKTKVDKSYLELQFLSKINCSRQDVTTIGSGDFAKGIFEMAVDFEKTVEVARKSEGLIIVHAGDKSNGIEKEMAHAKKPDNDYQIWNSLGAKKKELMEKHIDICELPNSNENSLKESKFYLDTFNKPSILCSDSHCSFDGCLFTWIKADPTFEGLKQITYEPGERVFLGAEPEVEVRAKSFPRRYIKSLQIKHDPKYSGINGKWFDSEDIELNKELVAIIGNKGSGKSALTDISGLLGNSHNQIYNIPGKNPEELFSFLNKDKFLKAGLASNFIGELHWYSGSPEIKHLSELTSLNTPESVEYLPQKYLEKICSNINDDEFRQKLNQVIFAYVEEKDRYGNETLEELIKYLSRQTEADIDVLKTQLSEENEKVILLEDKLTSDYEKSINSKQKLKSEELEAHKKIKPDEVPKPIQDDATLKGQEATLKQFESDILPLRQSITDATVEQTTLLKTTEDLKQLKTEIERQVGQIKVIDDKFKDLLLSTGLVFSDFVEIKLDFNKLNAYLKNKTDRLAEISKLLLNESEISKKSLNDQEKDALRNSSLRIKLSIIETKKKTYIESLDKASQIYQKYVKDLEAWENRLKTIEGDPVNPSPNTVNWNNAEILRIKNSYPEQLKLVRESRKKIAEEIFTKKLETIKFYNSVKQTIDKEIHKYQGELNDYNISIDASIRMQPEFIDEFFRYVNQGVKGSFYGTDDGRSVIKQLIDGVSNWKDPKEVFIFLESIVSHLDNDLRNGIQKSEVKRDVFGQMKASMNVLDFYNYVFSLDYLDTKYDLRVDNKDLNELSPGERGGLLLIFYLMLDKRDLPLIIDQPEDNLDNKSVYQILVKFLKRAKKRRQIIMVTHNPNLAVVADAEQIIHVSIDKKNGNDFEYISGAIENPIINGLVVDILEGTMPAFDNRKLKYRKPLVA